MTWVFFTLAGIFTAVVAALWWGVKGLGEAEAKQEAAESEAEHARERNVINEEVRDMSDSDLARRLPRRKD